MGFKDEIREKAADFEGELRDLQGRVGALEALAESIRNGDTRTAAAVRAEVTAARTENTTTRTGEGAEIDFGAIAFGLSDLRRQALNSGVAGATETIEGAAVFFADVFAKANPKGWNRDAFLRAARR